MIMAMLTTTLYVLSAYCVLEPRMLDIGIVTRIVLLTHVAGEAGEPTAPAPWLRTGSRYAQ